MHSVYPRQRAGAALATDPFLRLFDTLQYLDTPWYRVTRIMVPLLAWLLPLGHAPALTFLASAGL